MACYQFNPNPVTFPTPPGRKTSFSNDDANLADLFFNYYHRSEQQYRFEEGSDGIRRLVPGPAASTDDSIVITKRQVEQVRLDAEVKKQTFQVVARQINRIKQYVRLLKCDEEGCYEDSGSFVTPTQKFSPLSYALGNFSIYWWVTCKVGPRRCGLDLPGCPPGQGSSADYKLEIYWRIFDIYDFTGWQNIIGPPVWLGTDFYVFGEWQTIDRGTVTICDEEMEDNDPPCQDDQIINPAYNIAYATTRIRTPCPQLNEEAIIRSAMGRLLGDGKLWCREGLCPGDKNADCEPIFSGVVVEIGEQFTENLNERLKKCLIRVRVRASIHCRCRPPGEVPFPEPDVILRQELGPAPNRLASDTDNGSQ